MNVAYHLQKMGLRTALISRVGQDARGDELLAVLERAGLSAAFVQKDNSQPTGVVNATLHETNEVSYEIVAPVAWDFIAPEKGLAGAVQQAQFFVYGSLAARNAASAQTLWQLVEMANTKVVDINLRPPHYSRQLVERLLHSADIAKLNEHELPLVASWYRELEKPEEQVRFLQDRFSIPTIIVTRGGHGAMVCREGELFFHPGFSVKIADTIGSGDAFLAGFLAKTGEGAPMEERLRFANALGALIASREGACPAYTVADIGAIANGTLATP